MLRKKKQSNSLPKNAQRESRYEQDCSDPMFADIRSQSVNNFRFTRDSYGTLFLPLSRTKAKKKESRLSLPKQNDG